MVSPKLSVVIPAYNQAASLRRLLDSLAVQQNCDPFEILVVDDCSTDGTAETTQTWQRLNPSIPLEFLHQDENCGPGQARNRGTKAAQGEIVAFTDTDCVVAPDWLARLVKQVDAEKHIAGAGGRVLPMGNERGPFARYHAVNGTLEPRENVMYLVTCNCCYLREALLEAGGFTEDLRTPGGEDIAASIALWKRGWRFAYEPSAVVRHEFRDTARSFYRTWYHYGYGNALVTHRLLTPEERHAKIQTPVLGGDSWDGRFLRPSITGVRSLVWDLRTHCRTFGPGLTWPRFLENMVVHLFERYAYLRGWRRGVARYKEEQHGQGN